LLLSSLLWLPGPVHAQESVALAGEAVRPVAEGKAELVNHFDPNQELRLVLGLQPPRLQEEEQFLRELQDPDSPNFHHFLSAEEWNARFSPSAEDEQAVVDWAKSQGLSITYRFPNRLLVDAEGTAAAIEKALNITINNYKLGETSFFTNDREPSIPAKLSGVLHSIGGLNSFEVMHPASRGQEPDFQIYSPGPARALGASGGGDGDRTKLPRGKRKSAGGVKPNITFGDYDPRDIYSSYGYNTEALNNQQHCCNPLGNPGKTPPETSIAVATAGAQDPNDFLGFHNTFPYLAWHYQFINVDGTPPACPSNCDSEGTMDFEWATAIANSFGAETDTAWVYMYDGVDNKIATFTDVFNQILTDNVARIFSVSYISPESTAASVRLDTNHAIFNQMLGQGWTLIASAGDGGASTDCASTTVGTPAMDPDILAAGGTLLSLNHTDHTYISEVAWTGLTSTGSCSRNAGGGGGGCSTYYAAPDYQSVGTACGAGSRAVPDLALNADATHEAQVYYFKGGLLDGGGTSIVAPELAGFFAQENAYLLYIGAGIGPRCHGNSQCAPVGQPHQAIYHEGYNRDDAPHFPFYDIFTGCNSNDATARFNLTFYCANGGYDLVTGWGSVNMLQLAWMFNQWAAGDFGQPYLTLQAPTLGGWFNTDQGVFWLATDTAASGFVPNGISGFTHTWDRDPKDTFTFKTPGFGDTFYSGPLTTNTNFGSSFVSEAGQGCHTISVKAWDNAGLGSAIFRIGPICYDSIPPVTTAVLSGTKTNGVYTTPVQVTLNATDATSGVLGTSYRVDGGLPFGYTGPFTVSVPGAHSLTYSSSDHANNSEATKTETFTIKGATSTALASALKQTSYRQDVELTASVTSSLGGTATGTVTFMDSTANIGHAALNNGQAFFVTTNLTVGTHPITAVFPAHAGFLASNSAPVSQKVVKAGTSGGIGSSKNPSVHAKPVTFTATINGAFGGIPTGTVTFKDGAVVLGTAPLGTGHKANFTTSALAVGLHSITAKYSGDANFKATTLSVFKQTVN
jgi:kumamolisin